MNNVEELAAKLIIPKQVDDIEELCRFFYSKGYHQAEKDMELSWKDLATIEKLGDDFVKHNQTPMSDEEFYTEVLKRFKAMKDNERNGL